jgi:hypothetical protein
MRGWKRNGNLLSRRYSLLLAGVSVLYVLSVGPGWWLQDNGRLSHSLYMNVYAPIHWFYNYSSTCKGFLDWYIGFYADLPGLPRV